MDFLLLLTSTIVILYTRADDVVKWCGGWDSNPFRVANRTSIGHFSYVLTLSMNVVTL